MYEAVDAETAWDALVEQTEGDAETAQMVADAMVEDKTKALEKAEKAKSKGGTTVTEKIAAEKERKANIARAQQELDAWKAIASVQANRQQAYEEIVAAEEARRAEAQKAEIEARKAEEERLRLESQEQARIEAESRQGEIGSTPTLLDVVRTLYSKGKEVASKLFQRSFFDVAQTPKFMQELGLRGDKFTIKYGVIARHLGKDSSHTLTERDWEQLPQALQNPFAISKLTDKTDSYRIYTTLQTESGEFVVVGADVKNAGREIEVNAVSTVFGRRDNANLPKNEEVIYRSKEITPEQSSLLERPNFAQYPTEQELFDSEVTTSLGDNKGIGEKVAEAEAEVNTKPTDKQKEAGNYNKGHVQIGTFNVTIEQPKGSVRSGVDADGKKWEVEMKNTYGYIRGTEGVDGDHIDVFLSDDIDGWDGHKVFVVDQRNADGSFDEHKVMLGFNDINDAEAAYMSNYEEGWQGLGAITGVSIEEFEKWIASSHRKTKAFAEYKSVKTTEGQSASTDNDLRRKLADFNVGDVVRDYYNQKLYRIKKHSTNGVSTIAELDAEGNEVGTTTMNAHNNSRYSLTEAPVKAETTSTEDAPYSIAPAQYTTKRGKVLEMQLVKFGAPLTKEQQRAAKELAKANKGWYDREQGGFMMRSEEDAKRLAETILNNEDAVDDAQPVSLADAREVVEIEKKLFNENEIPSFWAGKDIEWLEEQLQEATKSAKSSLGRSFGMDKIKAMLEWYIAQRQNEKTQQNQSASSQEDGQDLTTGSSIDIDALDATKVIINPYAAKHELNNLIHKYAGQRKTRGFIGDLARALGDRTPKQTYYFEFKDKAGNQYTLRISNHNVNAENADDNEKEISIVIKSRRAPNKFISGNAEVKEYVYFKESIANGNGQTLAWIAQDIATMLDTGVYADNCGIAVVNTSPEVEQPKNQGEFGLVSDERMAENNGGFYKIRPKEGELGANAEEDEDVLYRLYGGNSGYVGYSMSKRAESAREEGRFPKTDFKKEYGVSDKVLQALVDARIVSDSEWHHTSKFGNKTVFYGWEEPWYADVYAEHKDEISKDVRQLGNKTSLEDYESTQEGMNAYGRDYDAYRAKVSTLGEKWQELFESGREAYEARIEEERQEQEAQQKLMEEYHAFIAQSVNVPEEYEASNGVVVKTDGDGYDSYWTAYKGGEKLTKRNGKGARNAAFAELREKLREERAKLPTFEEWQEQRAAEFVTEEGEPVMFRAKRKSRALEIDEANFHQTKQETNSIIDKAVGILVGSPKTAKAMRKQKEAERKALATEIYSKVLAGDFNPLTLQQIEKYINDVTPRNPFGNRISQRIPQEVERGVYGGKTANAIDLLFSRISESAVSASRRSSEEGRREIEERKKEALKGWAIATGNWHTNLSEFTNEKEPFAQGTDSKVYTSKDGGYVIKASKGKPYGKRFRADIDNVALFNHIFPKVSLYDFTLKRVAHPKLLIPQTFRLGHVFIFAETLGFVTIKAYF